MRFLIRIIAILAVISLATVALSNLAERWLIYPFDGTRVSPNDAGLEDVTEHEVRSNDETLIVWSAPPKAGQPVIFYLHGNAGNLAARAGRFQRFLERGYGMIALAYPGSSGSTGTPSEDTLSKAAAHLWLLKEELLPRAYLSSMPSKTLVYGESLGSAVAIHLNAATASDHMKGAEPIAGIILEAPFTSIADLAEHHYPGTGVLMTKLDNKWDSLRWASQMHQPLLILHGTEDALIPLEMGRQIHTATPSGENSFLAIQGAGHTDLWRSDSLSHLWRFIDQFARR